MVTESQELHVSFQNVRMAFGGRVIFDSLSCGFRRGKVSVILGGSGVGKSTILKLVGGLIHPTSGSILVDGHDVARLRERKLFKVRRKFGMLFQGGALLDSMTVFDNVAFPLREHTKLSEAEISEEVHSRFEDVGLHNVDHLLPNQLSGGMVRRAALARAIIRRPRLLLVDEPFSGLDPVSTKKIEALLKRVNRKFNITMIVVSHHVPSTMRMADHVVMLFPWGVVTGTPDELRKSDDRRVTSFLNEDFDPTEIDDGFEETESILTVGA